MMRKARPPRPLAREAAPAAARRRVGGAADRAEVEQRATAIGVLGHAGMEMDIEFQSMLEKMLPSRRETRRLEVRDARRVLLGQEAEKLVDRDKIQREAIERVEQSGIVFLDELDKICGTESKHGPDVSRQGVQPGSGFRSSRDRR